MKIILSFQYIFLVFCILTSFQAFGQGIVSSSITPADGIVCENEVIVFGVVTIDNATVQWQDSMTGGSWNTISTEKDYQFNATASRYNGIFIRVMVRDSEGKDTTSNPVELTVNASPDFNIIQDKETYCENDDVNLSINLSNVDVLWEDSTSTLNRQIPNITRQNTFSVTVTDRMSGCSSEEFITILPNSKPVARINPIDGRNLTCSNSSIRLSAFPADGYNWSTDADTREIIVSSPGEYTVTVSDNIGCTASISETITQTMDSPVVNITSNKQNYCEGEDVFLNIETNQALDIEWDDDGSNSLTRTISNILESTTYSATVKDLITGCPTTASVLVTVNPKPTVSINGNLSLCSGTSTQLTVNTSVPVTQYIWSGPSVPSGTNPIVVANPGTYSVEVVSDKNCRNTASETIQLFPPVVATIIPSGSTNLTCDNNTVQLTANASQAYRWNTGATTQAITVEEQGRYSVTITNQDGCTAEDSQMITGTTNSMFSVNIVSEEGNDFSNSISICEGGTLSLVANSSESLNYTWSNGNIGQNIDLENITSNETITVTGKNLEGCEARSRELKINVLPNPTINLADNITICGNQSKIIEVEVQGNIPVSSYQWSGPGTFTNSNSQTISQAGTYSVTVTGTNSCTTESVLNASFSPVPAISFVSSTDLFDVQCTGTDFTLSATSENTSNPRYQWSSGENIQSILVETAGDYTVTVTNDKGCSNSVIQTIGQSSELIAPDLEVTIDDNTTILDDTLFVCANTTLSLSPNTSDTNLNYRWDDDTSELTRKIENIQSSAEYSLMTTDPNTKCDAEKAVYIEVQKLPNLRDVEQVDKVCGTNSVTFKFEFEDANFIHNLILSDGSSIPIPLSGERIFTENESLDIVKVQIEGTSICTQNTNRIVDIETASIVPIIDSLYFQNDVCANTQQIMAVEMNETNDAFSYSWKIGEDSTVTNDPILHILFNELNSSYPIEVIVSGGGCSDTISSNINIASTSFENNYEIVALQNNNKQLLLYPEKGLSYNWFGADNVQSFVTNYPTINVLSLNGNSQNQYYIFNQDTIPNLTWVEVEKQSCKTTVLYGNSENIPNTLVVGRIAPDFEELTSLQISLYPNPNNGQFIVELLGGFKDHSYIFDITSVTGKHIQRQQLRQDQEEGLFHFIEMPQLSSGMYFLTITSDTNDRVTHKFLVR